VLFALIVTLILGFAVLWPLIVFEIRGLSDVGITGYVSTLVDPGVFNTIANTFILAFGSLLLALVLGLGLAFAGLHMPPRLRTVGAIMPLAPLLVPSIASVIGWIFLLSPRVGYLNLLLRNLGLSSTPNNGPFDIYTFGGMIFVSGLLFASFVYLFVLTGLRSLSSEYSDAASVCGARPMRSLLLVTLPQLTPSLVYGGGIVFMLALGQFSVPILLRGPSGIEVLSTRMFLLLDHSPAPIGEIAALGVPLLLSGILTIILQKFILGDISRFVTATGRAQSTARRTTWWAAAAIFAYTGLAVVLPCIALIYMSLSPFWTGRIRFDNLTFGNFTAVLSNEHLIQAIYTSALAAAATIIIILPVGYALSLILAGRIAVPAFIYRAVDVLLILPFAVPATLFGVAILFAYSASPFLLYGTRTIIVVAYCTTMIPYSVRLQTASLMALGPQQWEAATVSGAGPLRTFFKITIPVMRKAASSTAAIVFILLLQEFAVSVLVKSASTQVIGSVLYDQYVGGSYPNVAVLALIMMAITALGVLLMIAAGGTEVLKTVSARR
jgi:iron(III) transport system permease protein